MCPDTGPAATDTFTWKGNTAPSANDSGGPNSIGGSKSAATTLKVFFNGTQSGATVATDTGTIPTTQICLGARGTSDSTADNFANCTADFFVIAQGLTDTEMANLHADIVAFRVALGR